MKDYKVDVKKIEELSSYEGMEGFITIKVPTMKERMESFKAMGLNAQSLEDDAKKMDLGFEMMARAEGYVGEVDVKFGDLHLTSFEDISYYDFAPIFTNYVNSVVMNGIPLGKK